VGLLVFWIVVFTWTWAGMWWLAPGRYPEASAWWRHYVVPRAAEALLPAVVLAVAAGLLVGRASRRHR
jgi:hypothetical protein